MFVSLLQLTLLASTTAIIVTAVLLALDHLLVARLGLPERLVGWVLGLVVLAPLSVACALGIVWILGILGRG